MKTTNKNICLILLLKHLVHYRACGETYYDDIKLVKETSYTAICNFLGKEPENNYFDTWKRWFSNKKLEDTPAPNSIKDWLTIINPLFDQEFKTFEQFSEFYKHHSIVKEYEAKTHARLTSGKTGYSEYDATDLDKISTWIKYSLRYNKERRKIELTKLSKIVRDEIKRAYGDPSRADDQAPLVVYYTTDRAGYRFPKALPEAVPAGQAMAYSGALKNRTVDYKDLMARVNVATATAVDTQGNAAISFGQKILNAINNSLNVFLDGFSNLRVVHSPLRLVADKEGETLDIRQLSDGERSFIAMICDLSRRLALANPELEDPRLGAGVVFIDEIELHLHPKWQLEIAEKLRATFPNIQFIVTTHSPFILQTTREGEVISLDEELAINPSVSSLEEVSKYVMDVQNTRYSPRVVNMKDTARRYLDLVEESKTATDERKAAIQEELTKLLAPFSDNPAYTALLESEGLIEPEN